MQRFFRDIGALKVEQIQAIKACLECDVFVLLATGGGKSLIYQMAALVLVKRIPGAKTIVIMPLTALMDQQRNLLQLRGISSFAYSTTEGEFNIKSFFASASSMRTFTDDVTFG